MNNEWISVEKYNPPLDEPVLAVIVHKPEIGSTEIQVCQLSSDTGDWMVSTTYEDNRDILYLWSIGACVTHWMSLPEPPHAQERES